MSQVSSHCRKFDKEFRDAHPETIGENDKDFDNANYTEWLEKKLSKFMETENHNRNSTEKRHEINDPELTRMVEDAQLELMRESELATAGPA